MLNFMYNITVAIGKGVCDILGAIFYDRDGYVSRKLVAAWILTVLSTSLLVSHIMAYNFLQQEVAPILESSDYIQFLTLLWAAYFGTNMVGGATYRYFNRNVESEESGPDNETPGS
jgi:hypothetical protein